MTGEDGTSGSQLTDSGSAHSRSVPKPTVKWRHSTPSLSLYRAGCLVGLIGPDGVGKSSLLAILAGARQIQQGGATGSGRGPLRAPARASVCPRIAYMPQGLGKNLIPI